MTTNIISCFPAAANRAPETVDPVERPDHREALLYGLRKMPLVLSS